MILKRRPKTPLTISELRVEDLSWNISTGEVSYAFELRVDEAPDRLEVSVNPKMDYISVTGFKKPRKRTVVEKDLGWARLRVLYLDRPSQPIRGYVSGQPEDFTLSRLGVRFGRALLKDELIWHPILGTRLASWGLMGHIREYYIHVNDPKAVGPGSVDYTEDGVVFRGRTGLRSPGITIIGGLETAVRGNHLIAYMRSLEPKLGSQVLELVNEISSTIGDSVGVDTPTYNTIALMWNDVDPLACDNMIALRAAAAKALIKGNPQALHEAAHVVSVQVVYNKRLRNLGDYWLYEALPHTLALYVLRKVGGREVLDDAITRFRSCVEVMGGYDALPNPAKIRMPKSRKHHVAIYCKAPLVLWDKIAGSRGVETLASLLECVLSSDISADRLEECLRESIGEREAHELINKYIK